MTHIGRGLFFVLILAASVPAQETRGRVQGSVRDPSSAVIAGANVVLSNDNTGVKTVKSTNETGRYLFDLVVPGHYSIIVSSSGFKTFVQKNVLVEVGGDITVDAEVAVGVPRCLKLIRHRSAGHRADSRHSLGERRRP